MKRKLLMLCLFAVVAMTASAQKFALVDMDYILKNIPAYERVNNQLNQMSKKYQAEVDAAGANVKTMYENYQKDASHLSADQKKVRQDAITATEKNANELRKKYFGQDGELFKKRESLLTPIQDEVYNAVKEISEMRGYTLVLDRASDSGIVFGSPRIDISNEVLSRLGYSGQ